MKEENIMNSIQTAQSVESIQPVQPNVEEQKFEEPKETNKKNGVRKFFKFIFNTIITIILLVVVLNSVVGVLDMQKLNNGEDPLWYTDIETTNENGVNKTTYKIGLYVIEKVQDSEKTKMILKPYFLK